MKLPEKWQQVVEQKCEYVLSKVLDENEICVFYLYLKTEGTFWPTQYCARLVLLLKLQKDSWFVIHVQIK